jgi:branched-chain amino acid transport system permease protein
VTRFIALSASGLALGGILALVAAGLLVLYKATNILNFAHGDLITLGGYLAFWSISDLGMPTAAGYAFTLVVMFMVGVLIERVAHAPLRRRPEMIVVIATLAAALAIRAVLGLWFGSQPKRLESPVGDGAVLVFEAAIARQRILIIVVAALVLGALLWAFQRTAFGRQVRAMAADPEMAQLVGVRDRTISIVAFGLSATLAGLAGILIAPLTALNLNFGFGLLIGAFVAAVVGGMGSLGGVVIGAVLVGMLQQVVGSYTFPDYADTLPFIALFLIIAFRPRGLLTRASSVPRL